MTPFAALLASPGKQVQLTLAVSGPTLARACRQGIGLRAELQVEIAASSRQFGAEGVTDFFR
jgi:hypothetical protein